MNDVVTHLRALMVEGDGARLTDGQLLECFVSRRDPAALEALVRRHGPMVWGVCRRVLPNSTTTPRTLFKPRSSSSSGRLLRSPHASSLPTGSTRWQPRRH